MDRNVDVTNKVIILYILSRTRDVSFGRFSDLAIGTAMMDYFQFMEAFVELVRDGCILRSVRKDEQKTDAAGRPVERCDLTPRGVEVLETLIQRIPHHVTDYLTGESERWTGAIRDEQSTEASMQPDPSGGFRVVLRLHDGVREQMNLNLRFPNRKSASEACTRFRADPASFFQNLLRLLMDS